MPLIKLMELKNAIRFHFPREPGHQNANHRQWAPKDPFSRCPCIEPYQDPSCIAGLKTPPKPVTAGPVALVSGSRLHAGGLAHLPPAACSKAVCASRTFIFELMIVLTALGVLYYRHYPGHLDQPLKEALEYAGNRTDRRR